MGLTNFVSRKAESPLLKEGVHVVHLISYADCNSFQDVEVRNGTLEITGEKADKPRWNTPTEQTAYLVGNDEGVCFDRLSYGSYLKPTDLSKEQLDSGLFSVAGEYAVTMINGKLDRIEKPSGLATCRAKAESFLFALSQGVEGVNMVDQAIANKIPFVVTIKKTTWENPVTHAVSIQYRIVDFKPIKDGVVPETKQDAVPADLAS